MRSAVFFGHVPVGLGLGAPATHASLFLPRPNNKSKATNISLFGRVRVWNQKIFENLFPYPFDLPVRLSDYISLFWFAFVCLLSVCLSVCLSGYLFQNQVTDQSKHLPLTILQNYFLRFNTTLHEYDNSLLAWLRNEFWHNNKRVINIILCSRTLSF